MVILNSVLKISYLMFLTFLIFFQNFILYNLLKILIQNNVLIKIEEVLLFEKLLLLLIVFNFFSVFYDQIFYCLFYFHMNIFSYNFNI